jgi:site-specific recombinase XerC
VGQPRFGYEEEDTVKIMELMKGKGSSFAPFTELALGCGLRISELASLKGKAVDNEHGLLHMVGMGGKP